MGVLGEGGASRGWQGLVEVGRRLQILKGSVGIGGRQRGGRSDRAQPHQCCLQLYFFIYFFPPEQLSEVSFYSPASVCLHWDPRILHWSIFTTSEARRKTIVGAGGQSIKCREHRTGETADTTSVTSQLVTYRDEPRPLSQHSTLLAINIDP